MIIIGLTGSIGMGKSTVAAMFERSGIPVFDADAAVRALQGPGGRALPAIEAIFAGTTHAGGLHREKLGAQVFGNPAALKQLEAILHPLVGEAQSNFLARHRLKRAVVLDVPLLFEKGGWRRCDLTIVVSAPLRVQRARVLARPGMTRAKFAAILKSQMPDAEKRRRADVVIETGRGRRVTWMAVRRVVERLRREGA
ncbi:dephospho-CoA kinase [Polymorphobacter fuscus]|uniref:Dephospho-CoA kinase n=1 Tax=Sandarakinorhabdus fusca TaxID=1439888 RepID=A0A7C9GNP0_9SPHN|nr:dephospho-CoA kinase [Polymorphobacter fuscus]KAB7647649.1 dephospho-CoA kinase [Polymorphobacter fuscus]MQT16932.1 dephospho-CoA kinase [Polymorphobacter fuscus]NJC09078.1 dephospho-CoA kinase [Polymorphobacter fuscus]